MKTVVLVRHATPKVDYSWCGYKRARELINEYDVVPEVATEEIERYLNSDYYNKLKGVKIDKIICSPLIRAQLTCQTVFKNRDYIVNENFKEAENEIATLPLVRLKLRHWFLINRIKWLMGWHSKKIESKVEFRHRLCKAFLDIQASTGNVAIVAHGVFFFYLKDVWLRLNNYEVIDKYRDGCFTVEILRQRV